MEDGFLVSPQGVSAPFKFLQQGIKYTELSDEDKEEYESKLRDDETGDIPNHVDAAALNGSYLAGSGFTANQVRFVETIIDFLTHNGVMDPGLLFEPPFTEGVEGVFDDDDVDNIIAIVRGFNETVGASFGAA